MPPTFLIDSLNVVRRRAKVLSVTFGVSVVLAAAVGVLLSVVLIDYLLNLHPVPRLLVALIALGGLGYAAVRWVVKPVLARLSLSDVAGHIENVFPEFDDRLRSTVDFVQQPTAIPGSEVMKDRVVTEATELVQKTDLSRALITKPVWYSMMSALAAVGVLVAVSVLVDPFLKIGIPRLFKPFAAGYAWPKTVEINADKIPGRVPVGQRVEVSLVLAKGDNPSRKATIYYQYDNGPVQKEYMIRDEHGKYAASLDAHGEKLKVWMAAGDDETTPQVVDIVPRLAIQRVDAMITPPAYAQMQASTVDIAKAPAFMVYGSKVALRVQFNKRLDTTKPVVFEVLDNDADAKNKAPKYDPGIKTDLADVSAPVGNWVATQSFRFRIHATDTDSFENTALEEYEVVVKPDQLPTVMIESPRKTVDRTPDAYLPIQVLAEDDFGIASLKLVVDRIGANVDPKDPNGAAAAKKHWEIPLKDWSKIDGTGERQRFRLNWEWVLKTTLVDVKAGDVLKYFVEARDNYQAETTDANGKTTIAYHPPQFSSKLRVNVISPEEMVIQKTDEDRRVAEMTKIIRDSQVSNQRETKQLANDTKDKPEMSKGDKQALEGMTSRESAIVSKTTSAANQLDEIAKDLKENKVTDKDLNEVTQEAKKDLEQAAQKPMTDAANELNKAAQAKGNPNNPEQSQKAKESRNQSLNQSEQKQGDATKKLDAAMEKMDKLGTFSKIMKDVQSALDKQKELNKDLKEIGKETVGKKADELTPEQKDKLDKNAKEQKELAEKMDKITQQMEKMGEQMSKSDPQSAQAMKEAAQQSKSQQISPQQRQAAQQAQQNQQAQAQQAQQGAQLGIEVVLNTLKDAERRKLEQLAKLLEEAVKQVTELVRRQAGHNIDNLDLQGGDAKKKAMSKEELEVLYVKANRKIDAPVGKIELAVVTSGQEATERNTRSVAKDIEEKVQGAGGEIAQHLVRAAGKMGYAIVELRDKKFPTAYSPHQVEALAALDQALKVAEKAKQDADNKKAAQQAEAIKAKLEKVRAEQVADINTPTTDAEKARTPDGKLPREMTVRVGQMVGAQGKLSDRMTEIAEDLRGLGGIIYVDAGKEVAEGMTEVKEDLGKQKTGQTTQLEEGRVVEQLDAMIEALKKDIDQSNFNQKDGGGGKGGGGGKSKFPTEAELKLLKALQLAVNRNTKQANELPKDKQDKVALVNLGNRQGKLRSLLDTLLKQATQGGKSLTPEPKDDVQLPEEASKEAIENKEAEDELLGGNPKDDKETKQLNRVGDRMARSRQRLANRADAGKTTQEIQKRIVIDIDDMIKQAQQQMANNPSKPGEGQPKPQPGQGQQPGQQQANGKGNQSQPNNAQSAAEQSTVSGGGSRTADMSNMIKETNKEWGAISPRLRDAVIEGANEQIPEKYKKLVQDYYRGVATNGKEK